MAGHCRATRAFHRVRIVSPVAVAIGQRWQRVEVDVVFEERLGQRVAVRRRDVRALAMHHHAGQRQATAHFQNALAWHQRAFGHPGGQLPGRRPQHAEQRPGGARNAQRLGLTEWVGVLLTVQQGLDVEILGARDGDALLLGLVARHVLRCPWRGLCR